MKFIKVCFVLLVIIINSCATIGRPEGGDKDETPPKVLDETPPNYSVNFEKKKIKVLFDEYILTKDIRKELIISPPLKEFPKIKPSNVARKKLSIEFEDTLKENTTYTFNFGNAIRDFNENNILPFYKYIFSTGSFIDSLEVGAKIEDAFNNKVDENIYLCLYKIDSNFTDSTIFKQKPNYISNFLDSTIATITNIKYGKYLLLALKDENKNLIYDTKLDKIGFLDEYIIPKPSAKIDTLPKDSLQEKIDTLSQKQILLKIENTLSNDTLSNDTSKIYNLRLFQGIPSFKFIRGVNTEYGVIDFFAEGRNKTFKVKKIYPKIEGDTIFEHIIHSINNDTLTFKYNYITDSIGFYVYSKDTIIDTLDIKIRKKKRKKDEFTLKCSQNSYLEIDDKLTFKTNYPIGSINKNDIKVIDKDSNSVEYKIILDSITFQKITLDFKVEPEQEYSTKFYPYTVRSIFKDTIADTLRINISTRKMDDYGSLYLTTKHNNVSDTTINVIIELLNEKGTNVIRQKIVPLIQKKN